jgi:hypothetical protein
MCLQDLTGTIGAAVHSSVLQQHDSSLGPGAILLLQNVSVFTPAPGTSYIAMTARNIIKVSRGGVLLFVSFFTQVTAFQKIRLTPARINHTPVVSIMACSS